MPIRSRPVIQGFARGMPAAMPEKRQRTSAWRQESGNRGCRFYTLAAMVQRRTSRVPAGLTVGPHCHF
ncbi:hypothetical protein DA482_23015 [Pseudomonas fluorescens]|nr:hypothetical protein D0N73_06810 [Pseudomonas fluorescens]TWR49724.1 hypothetical protein FIP59_00460 [Pseudomonas fluorescens]